MPIRRVICAKTVVLKPAATQKVGGILLGMGVEVEAVVQKVDKFLQERLRGAVSDSSSTDILQQNLFAVGRS